MSWCIHCGEDIEYQADGYWVHIPFGNYQGTGIKCPSSYDSYHHPYKQESK